MKQDPFGRLPQRPGHHGECVERAPRADGQGAGRRARRGGHGGQDGAGDGTRGGEGGRSGGDQVDGGHVRELFVVSGGGGCAVSEGEDQWVLYVSCYSFFSFFSLKRLFF